MSWTATDDAQFRAYVDEQNSAATASLAQLAELLLVHELGIGVMGLNDAWGVVIVLDGWYSDAADAVESVEAWQSIVNQIRNLLDLEQGR